MFRLDRDEDGYILSRAEPCYNIVSVIREIKKMFKHKPDGR